LPASAALRVAVCLAGNRQRDEAALASSARVMVRRWCGTLGASIGSSGGPPGQAWRRLGWREQRGGVAVVAHAQHQHVNRRQLGQGLVGFRQLLQGSPPL
jgi:hypothetical protein